MWFPDLSGVTLSRQVDQVLRPALTYGAAFGPTIRRRRALRPTHARPAGDAGGLAPPGRLARQSGAFADFLRDLLDASVGRLEMFRKPRRVERTNAPVDLCERPGSRARLPGSLQDAVPEDSFRRHQT